MFALIKRKQAILVFHNLIGSSLTVREIVVQWSQIAIQAEQVEAFAKSVWIGVGLTPDLLGLELLGLK